MLPFCDRCTLRVNWFVYVRPWIPKTFIALKSDYTNMWGQFSTEPRSLQDRCMEKSRWKSKMMTQGSKREQRKLQVFMITTLVPSTKATSDLLMTLLWGIDSCSFEKSKQFTRVCSRLTPSRKDQKLWKSCKYRSQGRHVHMKLIVKLIFCS